MNPVTVPNVVGLSQSAATAALTTAGLTVGTVTSQNNTAVPPGTVLSQNPAAGAAANPGAAVALVVATGSTLVNVPNVVGSTQTSATLAIEGTCSNATTPPVCLTVGTITQQASATVPAGQVISQSPAANTQVQAGTTINLWVSSGSGVTVPNVTNQPQATAETTLTNAGLTLGTVTQAFDPTVPAGNVISQNPLANATVAPGTAVNLVVSSGIAPVAVPNVVGQALAGAKTTIEGAGFKVGTISLVASDTIAAGIVTGQNPAGGTLAAPGATVNLTISSGPAAPEVPPVTPGDITVPDVVGLTKTGASTVIHNAGLSVGATIQKFDDTVPAGTVLDQSPAAGAKVAVGTAVNLTVSQGPAGVVTVPNVTGQPETVAQSILQSAGLTIGTTTKQPDPTMQIGNVIQTTPAAGEQVEIGTAVDLVVSEGFSGPQQCVAPDVTGQTVENAREILFATCLAGIGSTTVQRDSSVPAGLVAAQFPTAGSMIGYNTTVNVVVSSGSQPPVVTPRVVGLTLPDATVLLENVGLKVGFVSHQTSNTIEAGRIISQNPLMTALAPVGWAVNLVISLGPVPEDPGASPQTSVPDVANLTLAAATAKLIEADLRVGVVSNQRSPDVPAGQVIRQSPQSEATVPINSRVNLTISFGPYAYGLLSGPAYITNYYGNTVSILNPDINQVIDNMSAGINNSGPSGIAVSPDGTRLYVANRPQYGRRAGTLSVIDLTTRQVIAIIPVGVAPLGVAVNPTGERVFVANEGSFSLSVIDTTTNKPFIDLNVPNLAANPFPRGVATHPNPTIPLVYVTNRTVNSFSDDATNPYPDQCDALVSRPPVNVNPDQCVGSLSIFDADLKTQVGSVAVGRAPEGVAVHPDGMLVYVANSGDRTVSVIETVFNRVVGVITLDDFGGAPQPLVPRGVAVSPDGNRLYVTDGAGNRLFVIDTTANHSVVDIVPVGKKPYGVAVSPDSKRVYVANTDDNTVSVIEAITNRVIAVVPVVSGINANGQWAPWAFGQFVGPLATVATPTFDPPGGNLAVSVKITSTTSGASIRYTTDGSTPTSTHGTLLNNGGSVSLAGLNSASVALKAIAFKDNWADSEVAEAIYSNDPTQFLPGGGVNPPGSNLGGGGKSPGE
ncbi:MAG: PASTA domain-containing protein [Candidatus Competibacter sp.]